MPDAVEVIADPSVVEVLGGGVQTIEVGEAPVTEVVQPPATIEVIYAPTNVVEVVQSGPRGPVGPVADLDAILGFVDIAVGDYFVLHPQTFEYEQATAVYHWEIVHPLDHMPAVTVVDSAGSVWLGSVTYPALNRVAIDFNVPISGIATLT